MTGAAKPVRPRNDRAAEIKRLREEIADLVAIAENFTDLYTCKGGRTINHPASGYVCFICGADLQSGDTCQARQAQP